MTQATTGSSRRDKLAALFEGMISSDLTLPQICRRNWRPLPTATIAICTTGYGVQGSYHWAKGAAIDTQHGNIYTSALQYANMCFYLSKLHVPTGRNSNLSLVLRNIR